MASSLLFSSSLGDFNYWWTDDDLGPLQVTMLQHILLAWVDFHYVRTRGSSQQCGASGSDARTMKAGEVLWHGASEILICKRTANTEWLTWLRIQGGTWKATYHYDSLCTSVAVASHITYTNKSTHTNVQRFHSIVVKHHVQGRWDLISSHSQNLDHQQGMLRVSYVLAAITE